MSNIPPGTDSTIYEESITVLRIWLRDTKNIDISAECRAVYSLGHKGEYRGGQMIAGDKILFSHPSYAACVKFALEYEAVQS